MPTRHSKEELFRKMRIMCQWIEASNNNEASGNWKQFMGLVPKTKPCRRMELDAKWS